MSVHTFSAYVHEVAKASAIKQMILSLRSLVWGPASKGLLRIRRPKGLPHLVAPGTMLWIIRSAVSGKGRRQICSTGMCVHN